MADTLEKIELLDVTAIINCPTNPRRFYSEERLQQLMQSMATRGLDQAVTVRPHPEKEAAYELVLGHRRTEAARRLGWDQIKAVIREMDDREVLEAQLAENRDREDLHPMEEAHAYYRLLETFGDPVEVIAEKYGLSASTVARRVQLIDLCEEAQKAFLAGDLVNSVAEMLARVPAALQMKALERVKLCRTAADARGILQNEFMLQLAAAPFDVADESLNATAGACVDCPKRTGNHRTLFDDIEGEDICTDTICYAGKVDVWWDRTSANAEAEGKRVMPMAEAKKVIQHGHVSAKSSYVQVDDRCVDDPKQRKYSVLLGDKAPVILARDGNRVLQLLKREEIGPALRAAGHDFSRTVAKREREERHQDDQAQRVRERAKVRRVIVAQSIAAVVDHAMATTDVETITKMWRAAVRHLVAASWHDVVAEIVKRREMPTGKRERPEEALQRALGEMDVLQLRGVVVEIVVTKFAYSGGSDALDEFTRLFRIDTDAIEASARAADAAG